MLQHMLLLLVQLGPVLSAQCHKHHEHHEQPVKLWHLVHGWQGLESPLCPAQLSFRVQPCRDAGAGLTSC